MIVSAIGHVEENSTNVASDGEPLSLEVKHYCDQPRNKVYMFSGDVISSCIIM
jgi:hypothetical protein